MSVRFACHCGRFLAESAIRSTDFRDDSRYYGIRSEVEWDCSRCGTVKGEEWEPSIVMVAAPAPVAPLRGVSSGRRTPMPARARVARGNGEHV